MAINQAIISKVQKDFSKQFDGRPLVVRSPGRVNIIGEHTDYNNGFVLPAAIDRIICVAVVPRAGDKVRLYSGEFDASFETTLGNMKPAPEVWPNYILGVADQLVKKGFPLTGFDLAIDGDVPIGSGLSSSAAVECATAKALSKVFNLNIEKMELALTAQRAEHAFAGVRVGIMDPFASVFGKKDHVIRLDCQSLQYEYVPFRLEGYRIVLLNTNVKHSLASSAYNTRRHECETGVALVKKHHEQVNSLRDVTVDMLDKFVKQDEIIYRRCRYVVEENERLLQGCRDLENGDIAALGKKNVPHP